jgi:hypothetical protein
MKIEFHFQKNIFVFVRRLLLIIKNDIYSESTE